MPDFSAMMKQAQAMQAKLEAAQATLAEMVVEGTSGGGLVRLSLKGAGDLKALIIDPSLMGDDPEILADLITAAHADARKQLEAVQQSLMREAAGPLAGKIPGLGF